MIEAVLGEIYEVDSMKQFQYLEFLNALHKLLEGNENRFLCRYSTKTMVAKILSTDYPYQEDDIEYLLDMVNYHMRLLNYESKKQYFKLGKALDKIIPESEFYLDSCSSQSEEVKIG